jgi:hypothetical protein
VGKREFDFSQKGRNGSILGLSMPMDIGDIRKNPEWTPVFLAFGIPT